MTARWQNYPLGAIPSGESPRDLRLGLYVDKQRLFESTQAPALDDWVRVLLPDGNFPQPDTDPLYNDVAGCCVYSACGHLANLTAQHTGSLVRVTAGLVRQAYADGTGYDPETGANDNGAIPRLVLADWKAGRIHWGCRPLAYGRVDWRDPEEVTLATCLFGGTLGAYALPLVSRGQADAHGRPQWAKPPDGWPAGQGPGTWGNHMIYNHGTRSGNTWGESVFEDRAWHDECCFELWFALLDISRLANGRAPNGFDFEQLLADAEARESEQ